MEKGSAVVAGNERKIVQGNRKTAVGKHKQEEVEKQRLKDKALFKATLKKKNKTTNEKGDDVDDGSDWESEEEDFPHVRLDELLDELTLDDKPKVIDSDEEEAKQ